MACCFRKIINDALVRCDSIMYFVKLLSKETMTIVYTNVRARDTSGCCCCCFISILIKKHLLPSICPDQTTIGALAPKRLQGTGFNLSSDLNLQTLET